MEKGKDRTNIIKGHTPDDKFRSIEKHINDLYRMKAMDRPSRQTSPIVMSAFAELTTHETKRIFSTFAARRINLLGAFISVKTGDKDKVFINLEIVRASGMLDSYGKDVEDGLNTIDLNVSADPSDIINVYMTYKQADQQTVPLAVVTATIHGDAS